MMNLKQLKSQVKELINKDISNKVFQIENLVTDALEISGIKNEPSEYLHKRMQLSRDQFIFFLLGHITLNPSKEENYEALNNTYQYPELLEVKENIINNRAEDAFRCLKIIMASAKIEANERKHTSQGYGIRRRTVYLLHGERGVGKTFFVNHLLTKKNSYLDTEKCIYVRINLIDSFGGTHPNLKHWLVSKLALIVYRYFNKNSKIVQEINDDKHIDLHQILIDYTLNNVSPDRTINQYLEKLSIMKRNFCEEKELRLTSNDVPEEIGYEIVKQVIIKDYSIIYIIDGLDRLDLSPRFIERFNHVLEQLENSVHTDTLLGGTFVIVCRTATLNKVKECLLCRRTRDNNINIDIKKVSNINFYDLFGKRIKYIVDRVNYVGKIYKWDLRDWPIHIREYEKYLLQEGFIFDDNENIEKINKILENNNRARVQLLQLSYIEYLRKIKQKKYYKLVESMCKGGMKYPISPVYSVDNHGCVIFSSERIFDNIFLPNIFDFPRNEYDLWERKGLANTHILAGTRMIQIIKAIELLYKNEEIKTISCEYIAEILSNVFKYDEGIIYNLLLLFSDYELLEMSDIALTHKDVSNYSIIALPKNDYIMSLINNVAYLNMCAMRLPLNKTFIEKERVIIVSYLDDINPDLWSSYKIINIINLVRIIKMVNTIEEEKVKKYFKNSYQNKYYEVIEIAKQHFNLFKLYTKGDIIIIYSQIEGIIKEIKDRRDIEDLLLRNQ